MKYDLVIAGMIRREHGRFWDLVARRFEARGLAVAFLPAMDEAALPLAHRGDAVFCIPSEIRRRGLPPPAEGEVSEIERRHGLLSLRNLYTHEMYSTERHDEARLARKAVNFFRVCSEFFDRHEAGLVLEETGGWIECQVVWAICRTRGIPHLFVEPGPLDDTVIFARNSDKVRFDCVPDFSRHPRDVRDEVDAYIARTTAAPKLLVPHKDRAYYRDATFSNVLNPDTFLKLCRIARRKVFVNKFDETFSTRKLASRYLMSLLRRKLLAFYYGRLRGSEAPYIFFPLHMPYDLQILVRAPHCFRQEYVVEMISRALPQGVNLLIKEHPVSIGWYPFRVLRSLAKLPNVRILHPSVGSHDVIRGAGAVLTINSKVGFEALSYGKPVVTLGESFYRGWGATIDVTDLAELASAVRKALSSSPDPERIKGLIGAVVSRCHKGDLYDLEEDNLRLFEAALAREMAALPGAGAGRGTQAGGAGS